jgi:hypothetical protein
MSFSLVQIKRDDRLSAVKKNEVYMAEQYDYDETKCTLVARIPDGHDPSCNHYWSEVIVLGTSFIPSREFDKRRRA